MPINSPRFRPLESLDKMTTILGPTKATLWTFGEEFSGNILDNYGGDANRQLNSRDEAGNVVLFNEFRAVRLAGGISSYSLLDGGLNHSLAGTNDAAYDFTGDVPFSCGLWLMPNNLGAAGALIGVFDAAGLKREWEFRIDAAGHMAFQLWKESNDANTVRTATDPLTINKYQFCVATYNGTGDGTGLTLYRNGVVVAGSTVETGTYDGMEASTSVLLVGASGSPTAPVNIVDGRLTLPSVCGKELSTAEVMDLYRSSRPLLGY